MNQGGGAGGPLRLGKLIQTVPMISPERARLKDQVLAAAESAIADLGFFGVSLREIASRAGVEPGTVHGMFGSKRTLLLTAEARRRARNTGAGPRDLRQDDDLAG